MDISNFDVKLPSIWSLQANLVAIGTARCRRISVTSGHNSSETVRCPANALYGVINASKGSGFFQVPIIAGGHLKIVTVINPVKGPC
jgi:hypothetical protein